ncbi:MAG: hypothetical protein AMK70_06620 [Nitrospira bacterium SG8_35_1]|nr:MAG: hypothetical protein AMK70_06620 [Nitrospira bacterium SG8_35_1]
MWLKRIFFSDACPYSLPCRCDDVMSIPAAVTFSLTDLINPCMELIPGVYWRIRNYAGQLLHEKQFPSLPN